MTTRKKQVRRKARMLLPNADDVEISRVVGLCNDVAEQARASTPRAEIAEALHDWYLARSETYDVPAAAEIRDKLLALLRAEPSATGSKGENDGKEQ